ncbi:MAG TPA: DUF962 domain-containing protein [Polyangiaceae bacterium LLY-WYZ-15_(1-7)]|nr:hypothetical protein [Myxococcales bacterium]MAT29395.1 hypothetical protein [Sandaracinus sp.]HJK91894.1 DUF962 domain-containing protein [Polyangiaceae bacterium LLY-WYZ-15_(1-7)]MBJ70235.1 hypothetical protein [Sandaracinus sp.]HJL00379.1 DUF962 domain-containing protein [Polyangiaceae bacterium LLY-WYZ-15_(1-7)]
MANRIESYDDFWPHYLSEHRNANSRKLHFVGTTGFLTGCVASAVTNPFGFGLAMAGFATIFRDGMKKEAEKPPLGHVAAMIALPTLASPIFFPAGVVTAYACAWAGHFGLEKNRPATFGYPLWSLFSDFKMFGHMLRGQLWSGDPLEELGLEAPNERAVDAPTNGAGAAAPA